jgi:para-nitrobenzyl esterase
VPVVETRSGRVGGRRAGEAIAFCGIPYAAAPRWAPPAPEPAWSGLRDATSPGPAAPQPLRDAALFTHGSLPGTDEECLNLNVFTPALEGARPVFVWIHGGGFTVGHASASLYSGERLAVAADAVVVTLNYRLGSLGWLGHPGLAGAADAPAANWGLLDQIAALRWVRQNIAGFGGDPARVTVAGQSAGALSAMDLLVAPAAVGLFDRVILQSPPLRDVAQPRVTAVSWAEALNDAAGASGAGGAGGGFDAARLRGVPAQRIVALHEELLGAPEFRGTRGGALPTVDPATLPVSPAEAPGASRTVDVLAGHTAQEGTFFFASPWRPAPAPERIPALIAHLRPGARPEEVMAEYRERAADSGTPADDVSLLVALATDEMVAFPLARWAAARAAEVGDGARVYRYRVDHPGAGPALGATHTVEVPLLFGTWQDGGPGQRLAGQAAGAGPVAAQLMSAWGRFIHGDDPGWAPVTAGPDALAVFGERSDT